MERRRVVLIRYKLTENDNSQAPTQVYPGDAGWDLYTNERVMIPPHSFRDIHTGVSVELPLGVWGLIIGRSSTIRKYGLRVEPAVIDNGYRGELLVGVWNPTNEEIFIDAGTRLAQFIPTHIISLQWQLVDELSHSDRGINSFGSSGV